MQIISSFSEEKKEAKREYQRYRYKSMKKKNKPNEYQATKLLIFSVV